MLTGWVSLTFDDALNEHLDHAIPILNEWRLRGTFYGHLAALAFGPRLDEWRQAARDGHELGNHTIFHPADARKTWVREGNAIDGYSLDRMNQELEAANRLLQAIDGCTERTFAYPCSTTVLGHRGLVKNLLFKLGYERTRLPGIVDRWKCDLGSTQKSYVPLASTLFHAARCGGLVKGSKVPPIAEFNRFLLPSVAVEGWNIHDLIGFTERGLAEDTWVILQFHGIGGGHRMDCDLNVFREFAAWLQANHADRVATVRDIAGRLWSLKPCPKTTSSLAGAVLPQSVGGATGL